MYMRLKDGKRKVLTLSYDDGVIQDIKLIEILNRYGLKGTFNINTGKYTPEDEESTNFKRKLKLSEAKELYLNDGHEIATHALTHPFLEKLKITNVIEEIIQDRKNIEKEYKVIARGHAYPFGTYNDQVVDVLKQCGICYARTTKSTETFTFPENWLTLHPTCHHGNKKLMEMAKHFAEDNLPRVRDNWMFYVWGHSYEFDINKDWHIIEDFAKYIGGRDDIWYATNIEIYDYVKAYENLEVSVDETIVHNPSSIDVWFYKNDNTYQVKAGETLYL